MLRHGLTISRLRYIISNGEIKEQRGNNMKQHWASVWGNAISIGENRPEGYNRNITFRYPIYSQFGGTAVRLTFDNFCGTEPVTFNKVTAFIGGKFYPVTFGGNREATVGAGEIVDKNVRG